MTEEIKNLAAWAEKHFDSLCSAARVTSNRSNEDATGWDFLLEFPSAQILRLPPDLQAVERAARAQVKSKRSGKPVATLKLSNARRFAAVPEPCFVVLMLASAGKHPVRIFAKHFWKDEIGRTLKRLREADHIATPVNRQTLSLAYGDADDHTTDLLAWMSRIVGQGNREYAAKKRHLNDSLGYDDGRVIGTFTLLYDDIQKLVDHSIGLDVNVDVTNVRIVDKRFGIEAKTPIGEGKPDRMHLQSHPIPCAIEITDGDDHVHRFEGDLFLPAIPGLPPELLKFRAVAGPLECIGKGSGELTINYHFNGPDLFELSALQRSLALMGAFGRGPLQCAIHFDGARLDTCTVETNRAEDSNLFRDAAILLKSVLAVAAKAAVPEPTVSFAQLIEAWEDAVGLHQLIAADSMSFTLNAAQDHIANAQVRRLLLSCTLELGAWRYSAAVAFRMRSDELNGVDRKLTFEKPTILRAIVDQREAAAHAGELQDAARAYAERHGAGILTVTKDDAGNGFAVFSSKCDLFGGLLRRLPHRRLPLCLHRRHLRARLGQHQLEVGAGVAARLGGDLLGGARGDDLAAVLDHHLCCHRSWAGIACAGTDCRRLRTDSRRSVRYRADRRRRMDHRTRP